MTSWILSGPGLVLIADWDASALVTADGIVAFALIILMKITLFVIGYKVTRLGYDLISAGAKGQFKFKSTIGGLKADLTSVSPGLLFVLLGVLLCIYAIAVDKPVTIKLGSSSQNEPPIVAIPNKRLEGSVEGNRKD
jgi:hypothetical protein